MDEVEPIEQRVCRQRTWAEDNAVAMSTVMRMAVDRDGAVRLDPKRTFEQFSRDLD